MCHSLSWSERKIMENFKNNNKKICVYCGKKLEGSDCTTDHLTPVSRMGRTENGNLALSCEYCNKEKSDMNYEEYIEYLKLKENIFNNNQIWNKLNDLAKIYENIMNEFKRNSEEISKLHKDKTELEKIIRDTKCNASEGYMLFRDLQNTLKKLQDKMDIQNFSNKSCELAKNNIKSVMEEINNLEKYLMNPIRNEYNIGKIGELNIERIDFKCT